MPALAALLASTTLVSACTGNTAKDNAEPLNQNVGSTVEVQQAKIAVEDVPIPVPAEYSWLLAQIENRCIRERGGIVPGAMFEIPEPPKDMGPNGPDYRNAWLVPPTMRYTAEMRDPSWRQKRTQTEKEDGNGDGDFKLGDNDNELRYGAPQRRVTLTAADGTLLHYPVGGCAGEAVKRLYGVEPEVFYTTRLKIGNIHRTAWSVTSLPALRELHDRYLTCMKGQGQVVEEISDRPKPLDKELEKVEKGKSTIAKLEKLEKEYIDVDALCRKQERIGEVYSHHYNKAVARVVEEGQSALVAHKEMSEHAAKVRKGYLAKYHS